VETTPCASNARHVFSTGHSQGAAFTDENAARWVLLAPGALIFLSRCLNLTGTVEPLQFVIEEELYPEPDPSRHQEFTDLERRFLSALEAYLTREEVKIQASSVFHPLTVSPA